MTRLTFEEPLPGLGLHTEYTLDPVGSAAGLFTLRPQAEADLTLFVLDAAVYVPEYSPPVSALHARIGLGSQEQARILLVATPGSGGTTVNLAAPVLVNDARGRAVQAVLDGWPFRVPLASG